MRLHDNDLYFGVTHEFISEKSIYSLLTKLTTMCFEIVAAPNARTAHEDIELFC